MSQRNYVKLETGILDSLSRQLSFFEGFFLNFSKILLKFPIIFKIFEYSCPFLSLTIIYGQRSISSLAYRLIDLTAETKNSFEQFRCELWKLFFKFCNVLQIFKISVFYLIYLLTRLEK